MNIDTTTRDVQARLRDIGEEASHDEIHAVWHNRPPTELQHALHLLRDEPWARAYFLDALAEVRGAPANDPPLVSKEVRSAPSPGIPPPLRVVAHCPSLGRAFRSSVPSVFDRFREDGNSLAGSKSGGLTPCQGHVVHGRTSGIRFSPQVGADHAPSVLLEAAPWGMGREIDWKRRLEFVLNLPALAAALTVVTGHLPEANFSQDADTALSTLTVTDKRSSVHVSIQRGRVQFGVDVRPTDALILASLLAAQIRANLPTLTGGDVVALACRTVGRMNEARIGARHSSGQARRITARSEQQSIKNSSRRHQTLDGVSNAGSYE